MKTALYLSASAFRTLHRPSTCEKRVFLAAHAPAEGEPSELDRIIMEMGRRHEEEHLLSFSAVRSLAEGSHADRAVRTREAVEAGEPVIYQGVLRAALPGTRDIVTGIPDFMIRDGTSYRIRDCKLARSIEGGKHPEIVRQLQVYGWLFEQTFGRPPSALEAWLGDGTLADVPGAAGADSVAELARIRDLLLMAEEPWEPVGWSKCSACVFMEHCWSQAENDHDVSLIYRVDSGMARALRARGIATWDELLDAMDEDALAGVAVQHARGSRRIGAAAGRILAQARALATARVVPLGPISLPGSRCAVMFDLEGVPPQCEELQKVSVWGMAVFRDGTVESCRQATAGFDAEGDRRGWEGFLDAADEIFRVHGDVPFIHWADYEKTNVKAYIERYGDRRGTGARVLSSCFDLLRAVREAFALPVSGYSLKVIEKLAGFSRSMEDYGGDWAIGRWLQAAAAGESERAAIVGEVLRYNEEDLRATAAAFSWARSLAGN